MHPTSTSWFYILVGSAIGCLLALAFVAIQLDEVTVYVKRQAPMKCQPQQKPSSEPLIHKPLIVFT